MRRRSVLQGAGAGIALSALGGTGAVASPGSGRGNGRGIGHNKADLLLYNGSVLTMDGRFAPHEAIAIKDGQVLAVGRTRELRRFTNSRTESVNLRGRTVIPGVNDAHYHPLRMGTNQPPLTLDLSRQAVSSIADIRDAVAEAVGSKEPGEWIRGYGWDQGYLAEGRYPSRHDIDDVSPDNPAYLREWSGHAAWVNTAALEAANITRDTEPPQGGEIVKDGNGEPTGMLLESATDLIEEVIPEFTDAEKRQGLRRAVEIMHQGGITSVTEAGTDAATIRMYRDLQAAGQIRQRVTAMILAEVGVDLPDELRAVRDIETDPSWLQADQVKIYGDGVPTQARTAWVSEAYVGGGTGGLALPGSTVDEQLATLQDWVLTAHSEGFQVGTHATGDRTINAVVDAYEAAADQLGGGLRHYVIHGDLAAQEDLRRMGRHGFGVSFNPQIKTSFAHQIVEIIGRKRADYQWPYRTALDAGVHVGSASDAPNVFPDFLEGLAAMLTRKSLATGEVFGEDEVISLEQALGTYTTAGAWQDHAEDWKGTLADGMAADLVVLDGDLLDTPAEEIVDLQVGMTVVGGDVVYDAASDTSTDTAATTTAAAAASGLHTYMTKGCCHV
ncbi:amidohydrolase [Georgenia deserti]|uniref:Amidohydrolase n=1 Tax=Georgenia deserti TaxID=2093781 RepID=A0ABW4L494_9MICO